MDSSQIDDYLAHIGATRPSALDADALRDLHERHLNTVPFENLSVHLGKRIVLDEDALSTRSCGVAGAGSATS